MLFCYVKTDDQKQLFNEFLIQLFPSDIYSYVIYKFERRHSHNLDSQWLPFTTTTSPDYPVSPDQHNGRFGGTYITGRAAPVSQ